MIVHCSACHRYFDDEFRDTNCPHEAFPANDGNNNFKVHSGAYLSTAPPLEYSTINQALAAVGKFQNITLQEFLALSPQERGFMGGAIMGNYSAHHPDEAFKLLKRLCGAVKVL